MENEERKTKVSNYMLKNLFINYTDTQIKFFMMVINKAVSSHYAKTKEYNESDLNNHESEIVYIPLDFIKQYKGKKHMSIAEIDEVMTSLHITLNLIDENGYKATLSAIKWVVFEDDKDRFKIILTDDALEYLILVSENYSCLDLEQLKFLRGKYEIGLYIIYCMYRGLKQKSKNYSIEELQDFLNVPRGGQTRDTLRYVNNAKVKLISMGMKVDFEVKKRGKKITDVMFKF